MIKHNMRASLLFIFSVFLVHTVSAQSYTDKLLTHKVIVNYPDHTIITYTKPSELNIAESDRVYFWFSANQINTTQGGYSGKLLNGSYQDFYLNKNLKESGYFDRGLKTGIWKSWNEDGVLKESFKWNYGKRNGIYFKYDTSGKVLEKGRYHNDVLKVKKQKSIMPKFIRRLFSKK